MTVSTVGRGAFLLLGLILCLESARAAYAQTDALASLNQRVQALNRDIHSVQEAEAELKGHITTTLKSAFDKELTEKQSALEALQERLQQASAIERTMATLRAAKAASSGHLSATFTASLDDELERDQKTVDSLAASDPRQENGSPSQRSVTPLAAGPQQQSALAATTSAPAATTPTPATASQAPVATAPVSALAPVAAAPAVKPVVPPGSPAAPVPTLPTDASGLSLTCGSNGTVVAQQSVQCTIAPQSGSTPTYTGEFTLSADPAGLVNLPSPPSVDEKDGKWSFPVFFAQLPAGASSAGVQVKITATADDSSALPPQQFTVTPSGTYTGGEIMRVVGGAAAAFAPSTQPVGKLFADMYLDWGLGCGSLSHLFCAVRGHSAGQSVAFGSPWRWWLQAGLRSTTAAATSANVDALLAASSAGASLSGLTFQSVESFELRTGISRRIWETGFYLNGIPHGRSDTDLELIAGAGFSSPVVSAQAPPPQVYCYAPGTASKTGACALLAGLTAAPSPPSQGGDTYLVVHPPVRTSFFSNWGAGIRLKTFYDDNTDSRQPAVTDITLGQDQQVTGGEFGRPVFHFEGFWPVPGADTIFLIFGGSVRLPGSNIGFLSPSCSSSMQACGNYTLISTLNYSGGLTGPNFMQTNAPLYPADSFRVGVAIDIVDLFKNHIHLGSGSNQPKSAGQ